jgi:hypothetical protein
VLPVEQQAERGGRIPQAVDDMRPVADLPLTKQSVQNAFQFGKCVLKVGNDDESFDAAPAPSHQRQVLDPVSLLGIREVVLRHRPTDDDATAHGHIR